MARVRVEVALALAGRQDVVAMGLEEGATAAEAVRASGLDAAGLTLGIGGRPAAPATRLRDGERVDLLRPLAADPREARRRRARKRR